MSRIEKGLHEHHARLQEEASNNAAPPDGAVATSNTAATTLEAPFARVNSVVEGSPADSAGLKAGDTITKFGWVDWTNHDKLARLTQVVSQNEGVSFPCHSFGCERLRSTKIWRHTTCRHSVVDTDRAQLPITVKALRPSASGRPSESVEMQLTPRRNWGGRGMLGCNLLPL